MTDRDNGALSLRDESAARKFLAAFGEYPEAITLSRNMLLVTPDVPRPKAEQVIVTQETAGNEKSSKPLKPVE